MRLTLVGDQYSQMLATFKRSAFRLELQREYAVTYERQTFERFLSGQPQEPTEVPAITDWLRQIKQQTTEGKTIERVRVFDEPPTDYQRFEAYVEQWNAEAGELIHTVSRGCAAACGLLPAAGDDDFWLFDDTLLMTMAYNEGQRKLTQLTDEESAVQQARLWRDLAVRAARKDAE